MFLKPGRRERRIDLLERELEELREENARLRVERQRPLDPFAVAAELDDAARALAIREASGPGGSPDDAQVMLDLGVVREGLIEVCSRLQTLAGQLHRQLSDGTAAPEIDRRVRDAPILVERRRNRTRSGPPPTFWSSHDRPAPPTNGNGNGSKGNGAAVAAAAQPPLAASRDGATTTDGDGPAGKRDGAPPLLRAPLANGSR
ncbi:MAG: hypothetical protein KF906_07600 [Actinobacteria bacterium]|nr:hypothetical protein [Actinomycetota bacterium]